MKSVIILSILLEILTYNISRSQNQNNIWYFGNYAGIDFNSGNPFVLTNGETMQLEGTAVICDTAGSLLFYTDGITVWNKNHYLMTNGDSLFGGYSSTQSALIIPAPGSDSLYYIFTVSQKLAPGGLRYSIVDMSLQGGLGEVIKKNKLLDETSTEKIIAVPHADNYQYWILAHDWNNSDFQAYLLSDVGLNLAPVISTAGTAHSGDSDNTIGYLKASHDNSKLALAVSQDKFFELFDFDNTSGSVTNAVYLNSLAGPCSSVYGVEFSPDNSKLYGSIGTPSTILQWDVTLSSSADLNNSLIIIDTSTSYYQEPYN